MTDTTTRLYHVLEGRAKSGTQVGENGQSGGEAEERLPEGSQHVGGGVVQPPHEHATPMKAKRVLKEMNSPCISTGKMRVTRAPMTPELMVTATGVYQRGCTRERDRKIRLSFPRVSSKCGMARNGIGIHRGSSFDGTCVDNHAQQKGYTHVHYRLAH